MEIGGPGEPSLLVPIGGPGEPSLLVPSLIPSEKFKLLLRFNFSPVHGLQLPFLTYLCNLCVQLGFLYFFIFRDRKCDFKGNLT